jgi:crotonobetainyl-CoA:carnitine CoA-transferase CaiB-like acyl-CoA transferase
MGVLAGIKVVDMGYGLAGPMLCQLLADMAADIVRVDRPGDSVRDQQGALVRLRGRRSILVDLASPDSTDLIGRLAAWADVVVTEPALGDAPLRHLRYEDLAAANPRLILCRIAGYGDEGPLADAWHHDHLVAARYGVYDQPGWRDGPTFLTAPVPSLGAALLALQAIGSALYIREKTGSGQEITTSLLAGALAFQPGMINASVQRAIPDTGLVARSPLGAAPFYSIYECGDGNWLHFGCLTQDFQRRAMQALGLEEELTALGFGAARQAPPESREQVIAAITARMKEKPYAEWASILEGADVPHAPSQWTEDLLDDPQVRHEGLVITLKDPLSGPVEQMGPTIVFEDAPFDFPRPMPLPGEHTDEVCREVGLSDGDIGRLRGAGAIS